MAQMSSVLNPTLSGLSDEELLKLEAKYCSWGDTVHYSQKLNIFRNAQGSYLYDGAKIPYLDLNMWHSVCNFGYKNKRLNDAFKKQLDTLPQVPSQYLHEEKIVLATKIAQNIENTFGVKGRVHFNVGGAAAIEDALKVVRNHTHKNLMFAFQGGYHGRTLGATSITSSYRYRERYGHFGDRANFIPYPYQFRCSSNKDKKSCCDGSCLNEFNRLFETEYCGVVNSKNNHCEFGAFFVEPVQATGGYIVPPMDYFKGLKKTLDKYKVLFVDDEVQMGFFRTGKMWAIEHFGVTPDIIVFAKAFTNGLNPLSGIWAKEGLISPEVFPPGSTHCTYSSNPLGTAAGLAVMNLIEEENFGVTVPQKGAYFLNILKKLQKKYPQIGHVDGLGLALRVEMCEKDGITPNRALTEAMINIGLEGDLNIAGKKMGLVLNGGGYYKNVLTMAPSLYITEGEMDLAVNLLEQVLVKGLKRI
jgi:4-aminobutyrate aminotransferase/(S)-3-amino-2-methylpropionate transaminase